MVAKILPGVGGFGPSHRSSLQRRIGEYLQLDTEVVICVSSGTNALRAVLKGLCADHRFGSHKEVIVPQTTVAATVEAVIDVGLKPVFVEVDQESWLLSPKATKRCISLKTVAIITVDWLGTQCDLQPFRELANKCGIKLISDSAQSFGASKGKPPSISLADATIYSTGYPKVFTGSGSGGFIVCNRPLAAAMEIEPSGILRHETTRDRFLYVSHGVELTSQSSRDAKCGWMAVPRTSCQDPWYHLAAGPSWPRNEPLPNKRQSQRRRVWTGG